MRKAFLIVAAVCLAALHVVVAGCSEPDSAALTDGPELASIEPTEVTIVWRTAESGRGRVHYRTSGSAGEASVAEEQRSAATQHEVVIQGLEPAIRYDYWLSAEGARYHFETQPLPTTPFSLLLVWGDVAARLEGLVQSETPAFVFVPWAQPGVAGSDPLSAARPSLPVFGPGGATSTLLDHPKASAWTSDWGGLRLVVLGGGAELGNALQAPAAHTIGVVTRGLTLTEQAIGSSPLQAALVDHNRRIPARPVAFVLVGGTDDTLVEVAGIRYLGLPVEGSGQGAMRFDVGPEATIAHFLSSKREVALREPKLGGKRSCAECRQLADRGAYEESVKAYQQFIVDHAGHYQIDDAHYAVAEILDERLFRYPQALKWYQKLVDQYPSSTLMPLARQRIKFLEAHSDHDYQPLARFERIRKVDFAAQKDQPAQRREVLAKVRAILTEFPSCSLAPEMVYWLANQYRSVDVDEAVATYRELIADHPDSAFVVDSRIEIGEAYYEARRYGEAMAACAEARAAVPDRAEAIDALTGRAARNVTRQRRAYASWLVILLVVLPALAWPPFVLPRRELRRAAIAFVALSLVSLLVGWLSYEQFKSPWELLGLSVAIAAAGAFGFPLTTRLSQRLLRYQPDDPRKGRQLAGGLVSLVLGLGFLGAGIYLVVYHLNEHYLTSFGM
ncbi:MAG: tetratricopeptide repeat protein [Deltaproteobacteria bacterium]|nr:tetratricopeptide repeat protein [Deltaproteobacteria bacterium]